MSEIQEQPIKRGGCLSALLMLMLIGNIIGSVSYLFMGDSIAEIANFSKWAIYVFAVMCIINIIFTVGVLKWKKWGVYGVIVTSLIAGGVNIMGGMTIGRSLLGLVGLVIMLLFVKPVWEHFK